MVGLRRGEDALKVWFGKATGHVQGANVFKNDTERLSNNALGARAQVNGRVWRVPASVSRDLAD